MSSPDVVIPLMGVITLLCLPHLSSRALWKKNIFSWIREKLNQHDISACEICVYLNYNLKGNFQWGLLKQGPMCDLWWEQEGHIKGDKIWSDPPPTPPPPCRYSGWMQDIFRVIIPFGRSDYNLDRFHRNKTHQRWTRRVKARCSCSDWIPAFSFPSRGAKVWSLLIDISRLRTWISESSYLGPI